MREDRIDCADQTILYDSELIENPDSSLFEPPPASDDHTSDAGRGTVHFIQQDGHNWVLKHYQRGGFIRHFCKDRYLYTGLDQTRMAREFRLLQNMTALGLPVPRPVAALIAHAGPTYRGSMLSERLMSAITLAESLHCAPLENSRWRKIGACIAQFHNHSVYHADLNANNIMLDEDRFYLIDFDKGAIRPNQQNGWPMHNLARLKRSLLKIQGLTASLHFDEHNWRDLLDAYNLARGN